MTIRRIHELSRFELTRCLLKSLPANRSEWAIAIQALAAMTALKMEVPLVAEKRNC